MARTDEDAVGGIVELDDDVSVTPFIETASLIVDQVCLDSGYSWELLEMIERWLAAHFYSCRIPLTKEENVKGISERYEGLSGLNFNYTRYGQQALMLDVDGNLKNLQNGKGRITATLAWLGTVNEETEEEDDE